MSDKPHEDDRAAYRVVAAHRAPPKAPRAPHARGPAAVLVAHGMGQQIPFETLEVIAEGLLKNDADKHRDRSKPVAKTVQVGGERVQRLELHVAVDDATTREVHVYEAYWAPLTEGQVTLRDVMGFLFRSAVAGIQLGMSEFRRWMFGQYVLFPAPVRAVLYLLLALSVVVALTFLNSVIVASAAARAPMQSPPSWLSDALFQDMTTVLNALVCALTPFVAVLLWATWQRRHGKRSSVGRLSVVTFVFALWSIMAAAILVAAAFVYHSTLPAADTSSLFGTRIALAARLFDSGFDKVAAGAVLLVGFVVLVRFLRAMTRQLEIAQQKNSSTGRLTRKVFTVFVLLFGALAGLAVLVWAFRLQGAASAWRHGIAWPLVVGIAAIVRSFLIQYAGDVAAYIQPQVLDRFFDLRQKIKDSVARIAKAVYREPEYRDIILVGHSLGSVIIYDVLNRMILDRQLTGADAPEVISRTRLLLTFGSPLDKTAFIFGTQGTGLEPREALAASVQPLITEPAVRPKWINIWSPWDLISGHLDYYDLPDRSNRHAVDNKEDKAATTLLAAHVEYWTNPLVFEQILAHLG